MINNITKELPIDDEIKKKIEIIKGFYNINLIMSPSEIIPTNLPFSTTGN